MHPAPDKRMTDECQESGVERNHMLNLQNIPIEWWLIGARAAGLLIGFICLTGALVRWRRASQRDAQRLFEQVDVALTDIRTLVELTTSLAARADELSQRLESARQAAPPPATPGVRGYEIAARMARAGSNADELVKSCGLTRHEAELVIRLHGVHTGTPQPTNELAAPQVQAALQTPRAAARIQPTTNSRDVAVRMKGLQPQTASSNTPAAQPRTSRLSVVVG
jgi:hypothetical protein